MGPKPNDDGSDHDLFRTELINLIDQGHELVKLSALIDWQAFDEKWSPQSESTTGRPTLPTRLMAALLYLKHVYALSDEDVVERWCDNPYRQHFSGERYFRHELPCDPSSLVRWRQRIGDEGCEWLLTHSIEAASRAGVIKRRSLDEVVLDTTVQPKAMPIRPTADCSTGQANIWWALRRTRASRCARATPEWARRPKPRQGATRMPTNTGACSARSGSCAPGWVA